MLQGRRFAYGDAHRYRLGVNHTRLPINSPRCVPAGALDRVMSQDERARLVRNVAGSLAGAWRQGMTS
jgi:catalase